MSQSQTPQPPRVFQPPQGNEVISYQGHHYWLGAQIGQGFFGTAYQCTDEWANDLIAKVIHPLNRSYEQVQQEWLRELSNLILLRHPNITYVFDAFEFRDTFYLVLERCSGGTLQDLMHSAGFDGRLWLPHVARDILQALDFLHTKYNYVHKDLHAGNVFVAHIRDRMVPAKQPVWMFKIGDLGISRLESEIDFFNTILAQWMRPPEFLDPTEFGLLNRQVDIYHVGLLLLRLLLNHDPQFSDQDILDGRPRQMAEGLQSPFAPAIGRALRRHVSERTQTAMELWRDVFACTQRH